MNEIVACICEGSSEKAIMEILLENDKLIFTIDDVIDKTQPILGSYYRKAKYFENDHLGKDFDDKPIVIYYIHDSKKENYRLNKKYDKFVKYRSCLTRPEIEILYIISVNKYDNYKNKFHMMKPSEYVKLKLKITNVKQYKFIKEYFSNVDLLVDCLKKYKKYNPDDFTIFDLLKI